MDLHVGGLFILLAVAFGLGCLILWLLALVDCVQNEPKEGNDRLIWTLVILLANIWGALIYWIVRRPQRIREAGG